MDPWLRWILKKKKKMSILYEQWYTWHDDIIKWKHFPRYWPFVWGLHKGQWRGALVFSLICAWINGWVNNGEAGDLRCLRAHYGIIVMTLALRGGLGWRHNDRSYMHIILAVGPPTSAMLSELACDWCLRMWVRYAWQPASFLPFMPVSCQSFRPDHLYQGYTPAAYFTKEVNPSLAKPPLNFSDDSGNMG